MQVRNHGRTAWLLCVAVTPIVLTARSSKVRGRQRVDLSWSGSSGTSFDVDRDGVRIATVQAHSYTDELTTRSATHTHLVCAPSASSCSNAVTVAS
jgi:hypothetical protein